MVAWGQQGPCHTPCVPPVVPNPESLTAGSGSPLLLHPLSESRLSPSWSLAGHQAHQAQPWRQADPPSQSNVPRGEVGSHTARSSGREKEIHFVSIEGALKSCHLQGEG